jgi:glycosyltransferase involved in cell wall biosynthesis
MKGLPLLLQAWAKLCPRGWRLRVVGPDEQGHLGELRRLAAQLRIEDDVEFEDGVYGEQKWKTLGEASLFVLPSHSENFGVAVAEALACGVPVITTRGTPWEVLTEYQCGWWIPIGVQPLARALQEAISLSDAERLAMGERGRRLVQERFCWPKIGAQMKQVYEWVLGGGPKPDCVL